MPGIEDLQKNLDRLEKAQAETREVVREAHEAIQTMRQLLKDLREVREAFSHGVKKEVDDALLRQVTAGLAEFNTSLERVTESSRDHVVTEFEKLKNILMYGNEKGRGTSLVEDWVRVMVAEEVQRLTQ